MKSQFGKRMGVRYKRISEKVTPRQAKFAAWESRIVKKFVSTK
jgi:hypothetical protein